MKLKTKLFGVSYGFTSVKEVLAKANEEKSGDTYLKIAALTAQERVAAKRVLSELTLEDLRNNPVIPMEEDEVTRVIDGLVNESIYNEIKNWTVGYLREYVLLHSTTNEDLKRIGRGLTAEMVAGVAKLMSNMDLVYGASKIQTWAKANTIVGMPGTLSFRLQPNHPTDDPNGIVASMMEGLSYGCGDAVIGVNPVEDTVGNTKNIMNCIYDFMMKWEIPTQTCVLSHISTQMEAVRQGAPVSIFFQSVAGTEDANKAFGIDAALIDEAYELIKKQGIAPGPNLMYFETGQGSEMSLDTDHGVDEMTLEARSYGFAKRYNPFMVNNVSGFIGPETLYDGRQMIRANLEDHFMGKLIGLPMGMAPCYTNHTKMDQNDQEIATMLLAMAGSNYYMGVPVGDDIMLSYQDTSFHDDATLRELLNRKPTKEFFKWLMDMGIMDESGRLTAKGGDPSIFLKR
ncbi:ethanolamine ammonia-lyase, large subunit, heavy chain [Petrocella atlantisensis]|uniref:Ethanolamine ammonia-lyase large subunit n=1 Tax=Petrocella atlantisensis TaxID=2173034 RepID=A0A3P7S0H7_9FIRM|nr:ethanolamine ammonia-lyase subunit EutB [Petrocella atlantisensis]VDN48386.1 ethanolamine ammonia-lyase, large subunit, heavy chain [Petrocella atlantisensis]